MKQTFCLARATLLLLMMMFASISAWAEDVPEIEVSSWDGLKNNANAATVTTENGVTTVKLNSCVKTANLLIEEEVTLDLNGYGIRSTSGIYNPVKIGSTGNLTLRDDEDIIDDGDVI